MIKRFLAAALLALATTSCATSQPPTPHASQAEAPFDRAHVDQVLSGLVQRGEIVGISALVYRHDREVYFGAYGYADREAQRPMRRDTLVQIYSMTKPIIGTALMQNYEQGRFQLDDPIARYVPELANLQVYVGADASGAPILAPPHRAVLVRDITRHTAGFVGDPADPGAGPIYHAIDPFNWHTNTLEEGVRKLGTAPLLYNPGEHWRYSNAVDVQALMVQRFSRQRIDAYLQRHIFGPLGMHDTFYFVPPEKRSRLAMIYDRSDAGVFTPQGAARALEYNTHDWPMKPGSFGLVSSIDDYMRFARMQLHEGTLDGVRILRPETERLMHTNQLSDSVTERWWLPSKGQVGFGIDFAVRLRPPANDDENPGNVGEFFWDGAASTLFWVDPARDLVAVMFVQMQPFDRFHLHRTFRRAVYEACGCLQGAR